MTNTYKARTKTAEAVFFSGVSELDLTPAEEKDALDSGLLELVPRTYRVLSDNYAAGQPGDLVELALLVENEAALIAGGHLERVKAEVVGEKRPELFVPDKAGKVVPVKKTGKEATS